MSNLGPYRECITPPALTKTKWGWSIREAYKVIFLCGIPSGILVGFMFLSSMNAIILISAICVLTFIMWGLTYSHD